METVHLIYLEFVQHDFRERLGPQSAHIVAETP